MKEVPVLRPHLANASVFLPYAQDPYGQLGLVVDVQYGANDTYGDIIQRAHAQIRLGRFEAETPGAPINESSCCLASTCRCRNALFLFAECSYLIFRRCDPLQQLRSVPADARPSNSFVAWGDEPDAIVIHVQVKPHPQPGIRQQPGESLISVSTSESTSAAGAGGILSASSQFSAVGTLWIQWCHSHHRRSCFFARLLLCLGCCLSGLACIAVFASCSCLPAFLWCLPCLPPCCFLVSRLRACLRSRRAGALAVTPRSTVPPGSSRAVGHTNLFHQTTSTHTVVSW